MTTMTVRGAATRLLVPFPSGDGRRDARAMADIVRLVVPDLVGLSLVVPDLDTGEACTLAATGEDVAVLDAAQYLSGATVAARPAHDARWLDLRTEGSLWGTLLPAATSGVGAVLAVDAGPTTASGPGSRGTVVHVYARRTAEEQVDRVATAVATWAEGIGAARSTYLAGHATRSPEPESLGEQGDTARAVARVAVQQGVDVVTAGARLRDAARRAGTPEHHLARLLAHPHGRGDVRG